MNQRRFLTRAVLAVSLGSMLAACRQNADNPAKGSFSAKPHASKLPLISPPRKGDMSCEDDKGETDPRSRTFDPKSCGYCGDGKIQYRETAVNCPIDFHCGNSVLDNKTPYAKWVVEGNAFSLRVVEITEECDPTSSVSSCESGRVCSNNCTCAPNIPVCSRDVYAVASRNTSIIRDGLNLSINHLGGASGAQAGQSFSVILALRLEGSGRFNLLSESVKCGGDACPRKINILEEASINLAAMLVDPKQLPTHQPCMLFVGVSGKLQ